MRCVCNLANARELGDQAALSSAVDTVLEGLGAEIDGLRHLITELRPAALDDFGLVPALEALARRAQAMDGLEIRTEIELADSERRLDAELESTLYRVVQEALTNVSRHAKATSAVISVSERDGKVTASVTDDGEGLPQDGAGRQRTPEDELKGGFGVSGMRERAELVGGELELVPAPGGGATMRLTVPAGRTSGVCLRLLQFRRCPPRAQGASAILEAHPLPLYGRHRRMRLCPGRCMHRPAESCMCDSVGGAHARLPRRRMRRLNSANRCYSTRPSLRA